MVITQNYLQGRALVTIFERKTSFTVSMRIDDKSVTAATITLLQPSKGAVFTITADNGKAFAYHEVMTEHLKCGVYFADPYCSWQRGLNENTNGLLRQYSPKSTDFTQLAIEDVTLRLTYGSYRCLVVIHFNFEYTSHYTR